MSPRTTRTLSAGLTVAVSSLVLTACQSPEGLAVLAEEPDTPMPPEVAEVLGEADFLNLESARLLGSVDDEDEDEQDHSVDYYVAREIGQRGTVCLVSVVAEDDYGDGHWGAACAPPMGNIIVAHQDVYGEAALVSDQANTDTLARDGWTKVSHNLWTR